MDSWITILLTLVLLIVPSIIKAKKEKDKQAGRPVKSIPWLEQLEHMNDEEEEENEDSFEEEEEEPVAERPSYYQAVPESVPIVEEEGGADRIPTVATEHFQVHSQEEKKAKEKIDVQKLIIYSEIMKPKFQDFDLN